MRKKACFIGAAECGQQHLFPYLQTQAIRICLPEEKTLFMQWCTSDSLPPIAIVEVVTFPFTPEIFTQETLVCHMMRSYKGLGDAKERSRIDAALRRCHGGKRWQMDHLFLEITPALEWLGLYLEYPNLDPPKIDYTPVEEDSYRLLEDRRLLANAAPFLSKKAMQECDLQQVAEPVTQLNSFAFPGFGTPVVAVAGLPTQEVIEQLLGKTPVGINPCTLLVIFDRFDQIRPLLSAPHLYAALITARLKLWHRSEWVERLQDCIGQNLRTSLLCCKDVWAETDDEHDQVLHILKSYQAKYLSIVEECRIKATEYYSSQEFLDRKNKIAKGEITPKVLIEQACHTVATKQFSRNAKKALENLGVQVYQHPNCGDDSIDYVIANIIEVSRFQPDLIIRPPNQFGTEEDQRQRAEWSSLPILTSLQDLDPHLLFPEYIKEHPLRSSDLIMLLQHQFVKTLKNLGVEERQILCEYIPCEKAQPESFLKAIYDVGMVKTLSHHTLLQDRLQELEIELPPHITTLEQLITDTVQKGPALDIYTIQELCGSREVASVFYIAYHEALCRFLMTGLANDGTRLALYGQGWEKVMPSFAKGHLHTRQKYMQQFLENKINVSINPWNEFHSRIFDGGSLGAFFLVYKVDPSVRLQALPESLLPDRHFVYFCSWRDLQQKVQYYLARPEKREEIGQNLAEVIQKEYTYEAMMSRVLIASQKAVDVGKTRI